jgi:DNA-binding response OmpR family regulator
MRILVIEDERHMAELLRRGLEEENYVVSVVFDGNDGLEAAMNYEYDAIVLDLMLPGMNGFEIARRLRQDGRQTRILMLTARDAEPDVIKGLNLGADDYLTKPFSFEVFLARLRAIIRRAPDLQPERLQIADIVLVPSTHEVYRGKERIVLTRTEFNLLEYLMRHAGRVVSRKALIEAVWGFDREIEENTLDAFISLLRRKLDGQAKESLIRTVRGVGYTLDPEAAI